MPDSIRNIALVSAAGAGKTRALTRRFLRLLLDEASYPLDSLYGITFTNEAAFEMKERIVRYLDLLISGTPRDESDEDWQKRFAEHRKHIRLNAEEKADRFVANSAGDNYFVVEYSDNEGEFMSVMEHEIWGDVCLDFFPISHH